MIARKKGITDHCYSIGVDCESTGEPTISMQGSPESEGNSHVDSILVVLDVLSVRVGKPAD